MGLLQLKETKSHARFTSFLDDRMNTLANEAALHNCRDDSKLGTLKDPSD